MSGEEFLFYFCRQSDEISTRCWIVGFQLAIPSIQSNTLLIARKNEHVVSNKDITSSCSDMYNHEEADSRMFVHVYDASINGYEKIKVVTVNTDVTLIAIGIYHLLSVSELWVEFRTGGDRCWYPIHIYANLLRQEECRALLFWYSFIGCDTVSLFAGKGKRTCCNYGNVFQKPLAHLCNMFS